MGIESCNNSSRSGIRTSLKFITAIRLNGLAQAHALAGASRDASVRTCAQVLVFDKLCTTNLNSRATAHMGVYEKSGHQRVNVPPQHRQLRKNQIKCNSETLVVSDRVERMTFCSAGVARMQCSLDGVFRSDGTSAMMHLVQYLGLHASPSVGGTASDLDVKWPAAFAT